MRKNVRKNCLSCPLRFASTRKSTCNFFLQIYMTLRKPLAAQLLLASTRKSTHKSFVPHSHRTRNTTPANGTCCPQWESFHTAHKQHQRICIPICVRVASRVLCELGLKKLAPGSVALPLSTLHPLLCGDHRPGNHHLRSGFSCQQNLDIPGSEGLTCGGGFCSV